MSSTDEQSALRREGLTGWLKVHRSSSAWGSGRREQQQQADGFEVFEECQAIRVGEGEGSSTNENSKSQRENLLAAVGSNHGGR